MFSVIMSGGDSNYVSMSIDSASLLSLPHRSRPQLTTTTSLATTINTTIATTTHLYHLHHTPKTPPPPPPPPSSPSPTQPPHSFPSTSLPYCSHAVDLVAAMLLQVLPVPAAAVAAAVATAAVDIGDGSTVQPVRRDDSGGQL